MSVILVTGAGGVLGQAVSKALVALGHTVKRLTTSVNNKDATQNAFLWNISDNFIEQGALDNVDVIIHLAGANIGSKRWSDARRREIVSSRVRSAELLLQQAKVQQSPLRKFISASAIGYYPNPSAELLHEGHEAGTGFLAETCQQWEQAALAFESIGCQVTILRCAPVLSAGDGLLAVVKKSLPLRVLPVFGSKDYMFSWIHIEDVVHLLLHAVQTDFQGTYNTVSPNPCRQIEFLQAIAGDQFCLFPIIPAFALRMALGERATLPLTNQNVSAQKLLDSGFRFQFSEIQMAVKNLLHAK